MAFFSRSSTSIIIAAVAAITAILTPLPLFPHSPFFGKHQPSATASRADWCQRDLVVRRHRRPRCLLPQFPHSTFLCLILSLHNHLASISFPPSILPFTSHQLL